MRAEEVKTGRTDPMTRWKLVPFDVSPEIAHALESTIADCLPPSQVHVDNWRQGWKNALSASPSPGEDVVERVTALLGKEIYCGQDETAPADNPCKKTWAAYKRRCPECALHPNERADLARAVIKALEG